jgi:uncharacterized protein YegP (UPF0339 family)
MKRIDLWHDTNGGWNWQAIAGNGRVLVATKTGYARRNTAVRYIEQVTDAKRRNIPVIMLADGERLEY